MDKIYQVILQDEYDNLYNFGFFKNLKEAVYEDMSKFEQKYGMSVEDKIVDEAGDVLWQFVNVLNQYDVSIEEVMNANVAKLMKRHGNQKVAKDGGKVR